MMFYFLEVQAQVPPTFTSTPSSPLHVLEGTNVTLEWTYNLSSSQIQQMVFTKPNVFFLVRKISSINVYPAFEGRFSAYVNDTFSAITFHSVARADSNSYTLTIELTSGGFSTSTPVELIVECKYNALTTI